MTTRAERLVAIKYAADMAQGNGMLPRYVRVALEALHDEVVDQRARLAAVEHAIFGRETIDG